MYGVDHLKTSKKLATFKMLKLNNYIKKCEKTLFFQSNGLKQKYNREIFSILIIIKKP